MTIEKQPGIDNEKEFKDNPVDHNEALNKSQEHIDKVAKEEPKNIENRLGIAPDLADSLLDKNNQEEEQELAKSDESLEEFNQKQTTPKLDELATTIAGNERVAEDTGAQSFEDQHQSLSIRQAANMGLGGPESVPTSQSEADNDGIFT